MWKHSIAYSVLQTDPLNEKAVFQCEKVWNVGTTIVKSEKHLKINHTDKFIYILTVRISQNGGLERTTELRRVR